MPNIYISAFLFILTVETLAIRIKRSKEIDGFKICNDKEIKMVQHADDSTNIIKDLESVNKCS